MPFLFDRSLIKLNEVEVNGEDQGGETSDYTADAGDNTGDDTATNDTPTTDDNTTTNDNNQDDQQQTDDAGNDDTGEDEPTDYTSMDDDTGDDTNTDDTGGGDSGGGTTSDDNSEEPVDDLKKQEEELYANMNPEQLDIKHRELKNQFLVMYDIIIDTLDKIGDTTISEENIGVVEFVTEELSKLQVMIADYVNNVYSMKSYMENSINYNRFMVVLNGINRILEEVNLANKRAEEENEDVK